MQPTHVSSSSQLKKPYAPDDRPYDCVQTDESAACMICLDCVEQAKAYPGLCRVTDKEQFFKFTVESTGALRPEEIVLRAIQVLKRKYAEIDANLQSLEYS